MRRHYLDNLRSLSVLGIVVYHSIYIFSYVTPVYGSLGPCFKNQIMDIYLYLVYPWILPIFFIIAGISASLYLKKHSDKEFIKSRRHKLLIPSTVGIPFHLITGYYNYQILDVDNLLKIIVPDYYMYVPKLLVYFFGGLGHLWFLQLLYFFSRILIFVRRMEKGKISNYLDNRKYNILILILLSIPYFVSMQLLNTPCAIVYRFGQYGFLFFVGYYLFSNEEIIEILKKNYSWLIIIGGIFEIVYTIKTFGYNPMVRPYENNILASISSWFMILAIFGVSKKYLDKETKFFSFIKKESWSLYLFHLCPLTVYAFYINKTALGTNAFFCYITTFFVSIIGALILNRIIKRIPIIRYLIIGIKK